MSDRDFILQEIRKIFKEQETASQRTRPTVQSDAERSNPATPSATDAETATPEPQKQTKFTLDDIISGKAGEEYTKNYEKITPGMDKGDTGDCRFLNKKAIEVNPKLKDPKFIYKVLTKEGVITKDHVMPLKPCDGLNNLVARFQYMALNGKLKNQSKIDPDGSKVKDLYYKPTIDTPDRASEFQPVSEQAAGEIAIDGKIGSRTAKLFGLFDAAAPKPKADPPPQENPEDKPEEKKQKGFKCDGQKYNFEDIQDMMLQTSQTLYGAGSSVLGKKGIANRRDFSALAAVLITRREADISIFEDLKRLLIDNITPIEYQRQIFDKITKKDIAAAARKQGKDFKLPAISKFPLDIETFMKSSVSNKIVSLYLGAPGGIDTTYNFGYVVSDGGNIPLIYTSKPREQSQLKDFIRAVKYFGFATEEPSARGPGSFAKPIELSGLISRLKMYKEVLSCFRYFALEPALKGQGRLTGNQEVVKAIRMVKSIEMRVEQTISAINAFQSNPNAATLDKLAQAVGPITSVHNVLHRKTRKYGAGRK